ncbi:MAG: hypothetical protein JW794_07845 [Candidatus Cloacimonetes bacterium]|nr:hypothetical protein [Candidatus Cloacimonadota bacterium]
MNKKILVIGSLFIILVVSILEAATIPRDEYIKFLELSYPRIVQQTPASKYFALFGDKNSPDYQDINPVDGIDDNRFGILQRLAIKFAPYMILNTTLPPMDFRKFILEPHHPLYVDTWDISLDRAKIVDMQTVNFGKMGKPCPLQFLKSDSIDCLSKPPVIENDDCKYLNLLDEFDPLNPSPLLISDSRKPDFLQYKVFYFDFPGEDEETWKEHYSNTLTQTLKKRFLSYVMTFVHPFIRGVYSKMDNSLLGYEFLLQYWFFYPYNDGGNDHEGDWEHINIVISPLNRVETLLIEQEIGRLLKGVGLHDKPINRDKVADEKWDNQLVIKRVEYCFHYKVMMMNYADPNVYSPYDMWNRQVEKLEYERMGEDWIDKKIRERAYISNEEKEINTHPVVYIGGDDKGNDQLLAKPGGKNRDSHGSYPFTGLFKEVGPAGATELVSRRFNYSEYLNSLDSLEIFMSDGSLKRGSVLPMNRPDRICIVPDWETIYPLLRTKPSIRHTWGWLMFPIHWGYPASISPFAGVVKNADTGNMSPFTPTYTVGWNQAGSNSRYHPYYPHKLSSYFPVTLEDSYMNDLGYLNLTFPLLSNVPPFDFIWRVAAAPFRATLKKSIPTFYTKEKIPFRFIGFNGGVAYQFLPEEYFALIFHPEQYYEIYSKVIELDPALDSVSTNIDIEVKPAVSPRMGVNFYLGKYFVTENTIRHSRSEIAIDISLTNRPEPFKLRTDLNFWEYVGSMRYNITTKDLQFYVKAGYGISFYRIENIEGDGEKIEHPDTPWVRRPTWHKLYNLLPNTWHIGYGIEYIPFKNYGSFPKSIDIGIRLEWLYFTNKLGLDFGDILEFGDFKLGLDDITVSRSAINLLLSISF